MLVLTSEQRACRKTMSRVEDKARAIDSGINTEIRLLSTGREQVEALCLSTRKVYLVLYIGPKDDWRRVCFEVKPGEDGTFNPFAKGNEWRWLEIEDLDWPALLQGDRSCLQPPQPAKRRYDP